MKQVHVALGDELDLTTEEGKILLAPMPRKYRLEDLLAGITKRNLHAPVDFGAPIGRESW